MDDKTKEKQEKLIEMVSKFCQDNLDEEYGELAVKLVEKMGRKHEVPFKRGRLDIWASAVIYVLAQINFLFDKSFQPYLSADDICDYFNTKKSTVSQKAYKIQDMFNSSQFYNEFSTKDINRNIPKFTIDNGFIVPMSDTDIFFDEVHELFINGNIDEALDKLETIKEDNSEYSRALFYKSIILSAKGDADAKDFFNQAILSEASNTWGFDSKDLIDNSDFNDFIEEIVDSTNPDELFAEGMENYSLGDFDDALSFFDLSLEINPNQSEALYYKALTLANLGEFKDAVKTIDKAIKIDSKDDRFWNDKGNFLASLKKINKAHKCFDKAIKLNPTDSIIWTNKGFLYLQYEKYEKALECYTKACELEPLEIHNLIGMINTYIAMGDLDNAKKYLDEYAKIDEYDLEYLNAMAQYKLNCEQLEEAINYWDKSLKIDDEQAEVWIFKALTFGLLNNEEELDKCLNKAAEIDPMIILAIDDIIDNEF